MNVTSIFAVAFVLAGVYGWINNIIEIIHAESISGFVIARVVGCFIAPLGAVLGYF